MAQLSSRSADRFWLGREVLSRRKVIGFDHLGMAQEALFRFSNGFHEFVEPFEYEVVGPITGKPIPWHPPLEYPETMAERFARQQRESAATSIAFRERMEERRKERKAARYAAKAIAQEPEKAVALVDEWPRAMRTPQRLYQRRYGEEPTPLFQRSNMFGTARLTLGLTVALVRGAFERRLVDSLVDFRLALDYGWRVDIEAYSPGGAFYQGGNDHAVDEKA